MVSTLDSCYGCDLYIFSKFCKVKTTMNCILIVDILSSNNVLELYCTLYWNYCNVLYNPTWTFLYLFSKNTVHYQTILIVYRALTICYMWSIDFLSRLDALLDRYEHGTPRSTEIQKKMPSCGTHIFCLGMPKGSQKYLNWNIRCVSNR